ncbi:MAG: hypothetical protein JKY27_09750 [Magnetovibrio sp.]|nr:hypothetical protein [Magnetovibrio sp.]
MEQRTIEHLIKTMKGNARNSRKAALLIGAGCSKAAGIPLASEFVQEIKRRFPEDYEEAEPKTYANCMAALRPDDRHDLISGYIENAEINLAHIAIAQLMKGEFVDRVLTTNFDPLVVRANALAHRFPAVYDMAASSNFAPGMIKDEAVFHLHGQRDGFVQYHQAEHFKQVENALRPLFIDTNNNRTWIVAGYSGENDPVFRQLAELPEYGCRLYWLTRNKNGPPKHVVEALGKGGKAAYWVHAEDADTFFLKLARELGAWPPEFASTPFTHLQSVLSSVGDLSVSGQENAPLEWLKGAHDKIAQAIGSYETDHGDGAADGTGEEAVYTPEDAQMDLASGSYTDVIEKAPRTPDFLDPLSWAYVMQGNALVAQAKLETGDAQRKLFDQAGTKFVAALEIKPDMHQALSNWGAALDAQAKLETGEVAARELWGQACGKYAAALDIKPDEHVILSNWGAALAEQARLDTGDAARELWGQACGKYSAALDIKQNYHVALSSWGTAFAEQARLETGGAASKLRDEAFAKYAAALDSKPDMHEALSNWGAVLAEQAKLKTGDAARELWGQACAKYAAALEIKPDMHEALKNWSATLMFQAQQATGAQRDSLLKDAEAKCMQVEVLVPGHGAYDLASVFALRGQFEVCLSWLEKSLSAGKLPTLEHIAIDKDFNSLRDEDEFKAFIAKVEAERNAKD